jgi:hypothetical protein
VWHETALGGCEWCRIPEVTENPFLTSFPFYFSFPLDDAGGRRGRSALGRAARPLCLFVSRGPLASCFFLRLRAAATSTARCAYRSPRFPLSADPKLSPPQLIPPLLQSGCEKKDTKLRPGVCAFVCLRVLPFSPPSTPQSKYRSPCFPLF